MLFSKFFQFLKGYVVLLISGTGAERFLNICMHRKIKVWNIERRSEKSMRITMHASDFKKIRSAARKTRVRVHIIKKRGLKNIFQRCRKRVFFVVGVSAAILFFGVTSCFIWSIDVTGTDKINEVKAAAELAGIKIGAFKAGLSDGNEIKNVILTNTDGVTWAWVYLKGTKAVIDVREGIVPPKVVDKNAPCDIVSLRDGVITDVTVKEGIPFCKKGDVVLKDDLLIGGTLGGEESGYILEHAIGDVYAATWHKASAEIKLYRNVRKKTGKRKIYRDLRIFSKTIPLYFGVRVPYEEYSVRSTSRELKWGKEHYLGIALDETIYEEETIERVPMTEQAAQDAAKYELEKQISENLLPFSKLENEEVSCEMIDDETVRVTLTMQFTEKIGTEKPIE